MTDVQERAEAKRIRDATRDNRRQRIVAVLRDNPEMTRQDFKERFGVDRRTLRLYAEEAGLPVPHWAEGVSFAARSPWRKK